MRKYIYIVLLSVAALFAAVSTASAADNKGKALCFVYVAESDATSVSSLTDYLDARYRKAVADEDYVLVMYLSNGDMPYIVKVNTPDDNRDAYAGFLGKIRDNDKSKTDPEYDLSALAALFESLDMVSEEDGGINYRSVDWHFHVTTDFWKKGYNESLISSLCFVMGVDHFENENFRLRCYFSKYDELDYDESAPFGKRNYCNLDFRPYYY